MKKFISSFIAFVFTFALLPQAAMAIGDVYFVDAAGPEINLQAGETFGAKIRYSISPIDRMEFTVPDGFSYKDTNCSPTGKNPTSISGSTLIWTGSDLSGGSSFSACLNITTNDRNNLSASSFQSSFTYIPSSGGNPIGGIKVSTGYIAPVTLSASRSGQILSLTGAGFFGGIGTGAVTAVQLIGSIPLTLTGITVINDNFLTGTIAETLADDIYEILVTNTVGIREFTTSTGINALDFTISGTNIARPTISSVKFTAPSEITIILNKAASGSLAAHSGALFTGDFTVNTASGTNGILSVTGTAITVAINETKASNATGSFTIATGAFAASAGTIASQFQTAYTTDSITDGQKPQISLAKTADTDGNGKIDQITIYFDEEISNNNPTATATFENKSNSANLSTSGTGLTLSFTESDTNNSNSTAAITLSAVTGITDISGNAISTGSITVTDGAGPALVSARTVGTGSVVFAFTESLSGATISIGDFTFYLNNGMNMANSTGLLVSGNEVTVSLDTAFTGTNIIHQAGSTPRLSASNSIEDLYGNRAAGTGMVGTVEITDGIGPTLLSALGMRIADNNTNDKIILTFGENLGSAAANSGKYAVYASGASISIVSASVSNEKVTLTLSGSANFTGTFTVTGTSIADANGNISTSSVTGAVAGVGKVLINEVVTDPFYDWSSANYSGYTTSTGTVTNTDEYIELYNNSSNAISLSGWTIEMNDGSPVIKTIDSGLVNKLYFSNGGTFTGFLAGEFLIIGNPSGPNPGQISNTNLEIIIKDETSAIIDNVLIGGAAGEAPNGNTANNGNGSDEALLRSIDSIDTNAHDSDFTEGHASPGRANDTTAPKLAAVTASTTGNGSIDIVTLTFDDDMTLASTGAFNFYNASGTQVFATTGTLSTSSSLQFTLTGSLLTGTTATDIMVSYSGSGVTDSDQNTLSAFSTGAGVVTGTGAYNSSISISDGAGPFFFDFANTAAKATGIADDLIAAGANTILNIFFKATETFTNAIASISLGSGSTTATGSNTTDENGYKKIQIDLNGKSLTTGTQSIVITATDTAGNTGTSTGKEIFLDASVPTFAGNISTNATYKTGSTLDFTWDTATDTDAGVWKYFYEVNTSTGISAFSTNNTSSTGTTSVTAGADGTFYATVRAYDNAGNFTERYSSAVIFDNTKPASLSFTPSAGGTWTNGSTFFYNAAITLNFTGSDTNSLTFYYTTGSTAPADPTTASTSASSIPLASGTTYVKLLAVDAAGNISSITSGDFVIDTASPTFSLVSASTDALVSSYAMSGSVITIDFSEGSTPAKPINTGTLTLSVDGRSFSLKNTTSDTSGFIFTGTILGTDTNSTIVTMGGTTKAGTSAPTSINISNLNLNLDFDAPSTGHVISHTGYSYLFGNVASQYSSGAFSFTWTASTDTTSAINKYEIAIGTGGNTAGTFQQITGAIVVGTGTLSYIYTGTMTANETYFTRITAFDMAGNSSDTFSDGARYDATPVGSPSFNNFTVSVTNSVGAYAKSGSTVTVSFSGSETLTSSPSVSLGGRTMSVTGTGMSWTGVITLDGTETNGNLTATGTDLANNTDSTTSGVVAIDNDAPTISNFAVSGTGGTVYTFIGSTGNISLSWTGTDAIAGIQNYEIAIGTGANDTSVTGWISVGTNSTYEFTGSITTNSGYYATVRATDNAGNISTSSLQFMHDSTNPEVSAVSVANNAVSLTSVNETKDITVTWSGSENGQMSGYIAKVIPYGFTAANYSAQNSTTNTGATFTLNNGTWWFHITATDLAGNTNTTTGGLITLYVAHDIKNRQKTSITTGGLTLDYETTVNATQTLNYGTGSNYNLSKSVTSTNGTGHTASFTGLTAGTSYNFVITSNAVTSGIANAVYTGSFIIPNSQNAEIGTGITITAGAPVAFANTGVTISPTSTGLTTVALTGSTAGANMTFQSQTGSSIVALPVGVTMTSTGWDGIFNPPEEVSSNTDTAAATTGEIASKQPANTSAEIAKTFTIGSAESGTSILLDTPASVTLDLGSTTYNGKTMAIYSSTDGGATWTRESTATVDSNGKITFTTTHFTSFSVVQEASKPTASVSGGSFTSTQSISLSSAGSSSVRYTTDGTTPTCASTAYSSAISIASTTTLKAVGCTAGGSASSITTETYTIIIASTSSSSSSSSGGGRGGSAPASSPVAVTPTIATPVATQTTTPIPVSISQPVTKAVEYLSDIAIHWSKPFVRRLVDLGIVKGYADGLFRPDKNISRAEFIKMTLGSQDLPLLDGGLPSDVKPTDWYAPYASAAVGYGFLDTSAMQPNKSITRADAIQLVILAAGIFPEPNSTPVYADVPSSHSAFDYIQKATQLGFIQGGNSKILKTTDIKVSDQYPLISYMDTGFTGRDVSTLAEILQKLGYLKINANFVIYDNELRDALIAYQAARLIPTTGYFGPITRTSLFDEILSTSTQISLETVRVFRPADTLTRGEAAKILLKGRDWVTFNSAP